MGKRHEFRVVIEGVDLRQEAVERINKAVQRAALTELAGIDFHGDFAARIGDGGTQGIALVALTPEQVERAGLEQLGRSE